MKRYTATEGDLIKLGKRAICRQVGHEPERQDYMQLREENTWRCGRCDARFEVVYPKLDYQVSEDEK